MGPALSYLEKYKYPVVKNSCEQANFIEQFISLMIYFKVVCLLYFVTVLLVRKGNNYGSIISEVI